MARPKKRRSHARLAFNTALIGGMLCLAWAVVVPQYRTTHCGSKLSGVGMQLRMMRHAMATYAIDRDGVYPRNPATDLTSQVELVPLTGGAPRLLGPYIRRRLPISPLDMRNNVFVVDRMPETPNGRTAWIYARDTGEIRANHMGESRFGDRYFDQ